MVDSAAFALAASVLFNRGGAAGPPRLHNADYRMARLSGVAAREDQLPIINLALCNVRAGSPLSEAPLFPTKA